MTARSTERRDRSSDGPARKALLALAVAAPALATGLTSYLTAEAKLREAQAAKMAVLDNYGSYVEDQLRRDAALVEYLRRCREVEAAATTWADTTLSAVPAPLATHYMLTTGEEQPDAALDRIAKSEGWEPSK